MRPNIMDVLPEGATAGPTSSPTTRRLSDLMVVAEVALALMLLVSAGLLIRSFIPARRPSDPGYRTSGIVAAHVVLPRGAVSDTGREAPVRRGISPRG